MLRSTAVSWKCKHQLTCEVKATGELLHRLVDTHELSELQTTGIGFTPACLDFLLVPPKRAHAQREIACRFDEQIARLRPFGNNREVVVGIKTMEGLTTENEQGLGAA